MGDGTWSSPRNKFAVHSQDTVKQQATITYRCSFHFLNICMYVYIFTELLALHVYVCSVKHGFSKTCKLSELVATCRHEESNWEQLY